MANYERRERYYTEGNTVRKTYYEAAPVKTPVTEPKKVTERRVQEKSFVSAGYVCTLVVATALVVFMSISFLTLQSKRDANIDKIAALQKQINVLNADNNVKELNIYSNIDYDALYNRAIEMGMGNATQEQIVAYDRDTLEYVKQYEDIPEN